MNVMFDKTNLKQYQLQDGGELPSWELKDLPSPNSEYWVLTIDEVADGLALTSVHSPDVEVLKAGYKRYAILKTDKDVRLTFDFAKGYALDVVYLNLHSVLYPKRKYLPEGANVSEYLHDDWIDMCIEIIDVLDGSTGAECTDVEVQISAVGGMVGGLYDRDVRFRMPAHDVRIEVTYVPNPNKGKVNVDLEAIRGLLARKRGLMPFNAIITDAVYSDDYDFGSRDEDIYALTDRYTYRIGQRLRLRVYTHTEADLHLMMGDKEYLPTKVRKTYMRQEKAEGYVYEYDFSKVVFEVADTTMRVEKR